MFGFFMLLASGCVSVPPQSAELSAMMGKQIARAKKHDASMIDAFGTQSRKLIDERMRYYWIPRLIKEMLTMENDEGDTFERSVCKRPGEMDRALEMQDFIQAVNDRVREREMRYTKALRKELRGLRSAHRTEYDGLERMSNALTENLKSVLKDQKQRDTVLKAWGLPTDLATPISQASERLDGLLQEK